MPSDAPATRSTLSDLPLGAVINGRYRVVSLIASGGMGRVYRAEQAPLGRVVALKVLRTTAQVDDPRLEENFRKRFFLEASILAKLQHVNVVTLFDYGRIEGLERDRYFMAMEYLAGETLADRIRDGIALPPQDALRIMRQMARGLREAHKLGAIHRDLKPSNVMLVPEADGGEIVKILDFGVGKLLGGPEDQALTQQGSFLGSPRYVAPEQVNEKRVDARTDVYALGVIAYEMLCGFVPFDRETNLETILAHCGAPLPRMSERNPAVRVPVVLEAFIRRCLEKSPNDRPASMEDVLRCISDVERTLFGVTSLGASPNDLTPQIMAAPPPPARSRPEAFDDTLASSPQLTRAREPSIGTQSPLTSPAITSPGAAVSGRTQQRAVVALIAVIVAGAGAAAAVATMRAGHPSPAALPAATAAPPAATATSFTLVLDSTPQGAEVLENEDLLGTTPMQVTIARAGVRSAPRRFVVRLDGYAPYTLLQGDSESIVHVVAPLAPASSALAPQHTQTVPSSLPSSLPPSLMSAPPNVSASSPPPRAPQRAPRSATSPAAPPQQDLDIKLTR